MAMVEEIKRLLLAPILAVDIHQVIADSMSAHDSDIVQLNQQQLAAGQLSDGSAIKPFYKPITVKIKRKQGQPTDKVTLKSKGDFYKGMYAKPTSGGNTEIGSTDEKAERLERKYQVTIFGLSVPSLDQLGDRMKPTIQDNFKRALG